MESKSSRPEGDDQDGESPDFTAPLMIALGVIGAVLTVFTQAVPVVDEFWSRPLRSAVIALALLDLSAPLVYAALRMRKSAAAKQVLWCCAGAGALTVASAVGAAVGHAVRPHASAPAPAAVSTSGSTSVAVVRSAPPTTAGVTPGAGAPPGGPFYERVNSSTGALITGSMDTAVQLARYPNGAIVAVACLYQNTNNEMPSVQGGFWYRLAAAPWQGDWTPAASYWNGSSTAIVDPGVPLCP